MARLFDDANSEGLYTNIPAGWNNDEPFTIAAWFNLDASPGYSGIVRFARNAVGADQEFSLLVRDDPDLNLISRTWGGATVIISRHISFKDSRLV